jgi:hypothetical protein
MQQQGFVSTFSSTLVRTLAGDETFHWPLLGRAEVWNEAKQRSMRVLGRVLRPCLRDFSMTWGAFVSHQCPWFQWVTIKSTSVTAKSRFEPRRPTISHKESMVYGLYQVTAQSAVVRTGTNNLYRRSSSH